jgi:DNA polymerase-3 subunit delta'
MPAADIATRHPESWARLLAVRHRRAWGHAYLLTGDSPACLEAFALAWAQACACQNPREDGAACTACAACRAFAAGSYPELHGLRPESKSRQILIGDLDKAGAPRGVRHLIRELSLTAGEGLLKIGLVTEAERMNPQAQNAFLKTLEEPTRDTLLLLTSTNPSQLLPTVRSRCQTIRLLQNRRDYELAVRHGLFPVLATLRRGAGAAAALAAARRLGAITTQLRQAAQATAGPPSARATQAAEDRNLRKQLEDEEKAAQDAEFLRLRQELVDAICCWFQQFALAAAGVPLDTLPHPELPAAAGLAPAALRECPWDEAEGNLRLAGDLAFYLAANVEERLCFESFCLGVCRRAATPPPATAAG